MSEQDYMYAWLVYLGGSLVILVGWWQFTQVFRFFPIRHLLRIVGTVLLLTPHSVEEGTVQMAPALFVAALDPLLLENGDWYRAGQSLMVVLAAVLVVYIVIGLWWRTRRHRKQELKALEKDRKELLEEGEHERAAA